MQKNILIMAGGTGGHIYPALSVADKLREKGVHCEWLGTHNGLEVKLVPQQTYPLHCIDMQGLRGKGLLRKIYMPFMLGRALIQTMYIMYKLKPAIVLGMGGFVSAPGGLAAWLMRVPLVLHEQNAIAGLANRCLLPFAKQVLTGFPNTFAEQTKVQYTGNPVRNLITHSVKQTDSKQLCLLVLGGSLGAHYLNQVLPKFKLSTDIDIQIKHQCGQHDKISTEQAYGTSIDVEVVEYIEDMADAYNWADIVICRAGAMTIAELCMAGVAAILVPFPYAVDDHQTANARFLSDQDAAILVQQTELTVSWLQSTLSRFNSTRELIKTMASKAHALAKPSASQQVSNVCLELIYD